MLFRSKGLCEGEIQCELVLLYEMMSTLCHAKDAHYKSMQGNIWLQATIVRMIKGKSACSYHVQFCECIYSSFMSGSAQAKPADLGSSSLLRIWEVRLWMRAYTLSQVFTGFSMIFIELTRDGLPVGASWNSTVTLSAGLVD